MDKDGAFMDVSMEIDFVPWGLTAGELHELQGILLDFPLTPGGLAGPPPFPMTQGFRIVVSVPVPGGEAVAYWVPLDGWDPGAAEPETLYPGREAANRLSDFCRRVEAAHGDDEPVSASRMIRRGTHPAWDVLEERLRKRWPERSDQGRRDFLDSLAFRGDWEESRGCPQSDLDGAVAAAEAVYRTAVAEPAVYEELYRRLSFAYG